MRSLVLKTGIHFGGDKEWNFVQGLLKNEKTQQSEREQLLAALGDSISAKKIIRYISFNCMILMSVFLSRCVFQKCVFSP